jgi:hypothetical protein
VEDSTTFIDTLEDDIVSEAQDTQTILSAYVDGLQLSLDPERMKKTMKEIYTEAVTLENI